MFQNSFQGNQFDLSQFSDEQLMEMIRNNPELKSKYDMFVTQQRKTMNNPVLKTKPLSDTEYLKLKDIKEYLDEEGGMMIEPTQHFVLKAFEHSGEKVFFNVTSHSVIDAPEEKQQVDNNNETGIRVPMSVGSIKEDHDVKGDVCKVIDLVINPQIAQNLTKDDNLREFFCQLIQTYVDQKYKIKLQDKFILLKLKYKGKSVSFQRVKGKKAPKIDIIDEKPNDQQNNQNNNQEEIDETEKIRKQQKEQFEKDQLQQSIPQTIQQPEWELYIIYDNYEEQYDGDIDFEKIKQIRFQIQTPLLISGKGIKLKLNQEQFQLTAGKFYKIQLSFPLKIDQNSVKAKYLVEKRELWILANILICQQNENNQQIEIQQESQITNGKNVNLENNLLFDIV